MHKPIMMLQNDKKKSRRKAMQAQPKESEGEKLGGQAVEPLIQENNKGTGATNAAVSFSLGYIQPPMALC